MKIISRPSPSWSKIKKIPTSQPTWNPSLRELTWKSPRRNCATKIWLWYLRTTSITDGSSQTLNLSASSPPSPWGKIITILTSISTLLQCPLSSITRPKTPIMSTSSRSTISSMGRGSLTSVSKRRSENKRKESRVRRRLLRRRRNKRRRRALRNECYVLRIYRINPY